MFSSRKWAFILVVTSCTILIAHLQSYALSHAENQTKGSVGNTVTMVQYKFLQCAGNMLYPIAVVFPTS